MRAFILGSTNEKRREEGPRHGWNQKRHCGPRYSRLRLVTLDRQDARFPVILNGEASQTEADDHSLQPIRTRRIVALEVQEPLVRSNNSPSRQIRSSQPSDDTTALSRRLHVNAGHRLIVSIFTVLRHLGYTNECSGEAEPFRIKAGLDRITSKDGIQATHAWASPPSAVDSAHTP